MKVGFNWVQGFGCVFAHDNWCQCVLLMLDSVIIYWALSAIWCFSSLDCIWCLCFSLVIILHMVLMFFLSDHVFKILATHGKRDGTSWVQLKILLLNMYVCLLPIKFSMFFSSISTLYLGFPNMVHITISTHSIFNEKFINVKINDLWST